MTDRPLSPDDLAQRWNCSAQAVRKLVRQGKLRHFKIGKLIRIPVEAVEEYTCAHMKIPSQPSSNTEANGASATTTPEESGNVRPYIALIEHKPKPTSLSG